ncbi:MAG: alpha/beta hydrolase [Intrasporangium sp.]|uniref:alpha/beta hydrolase n=1 Tax=Intrasporangium sp. TaxID=1925024 RepID=UPI002647AAE6|nr:alpha/beta hydrolase [Intrasporangium sp.]MDN5796278.1 alpha/beta hydrolase [Intrasporangium sp.]
MSARRACAGDHARAALDRPLRRPRRRTLAVVVAALVAIVLTACTTGGPAPVELPPPTSETGVNAAPTAALAPYYSQQLSWSTCDGSFQCARLTVPVDYADPSTGDIRIVVLRAPARDQKDRIGSLVVNPGGPGASGVDYAKDADLIVGPPVRKYFDVVGFDPRGVGASAPIDCLTDHQLDQFLGTDPTPDDHPEQERLLGEAKDMANGCEAHNKALLPHVSTVDVAKDLDVLRAALGDSRLTYLGKSYGTFLGATYAEHFTDRVGRMVLDGVVPPDLTSAQMSKGQAEGFELATRAYVQDCIEAGGCPLGDTVDEGMQWIRDFLHRLDGQPIPSGDSAVPELNEAWASLGIAAAMYDQGSWGILTDALLAAEQGDGSDLMRLADTYADRDPGGGYAGNIMEAIYAVNCLDRPDSPDLAAYQRYAKEFTKVAPTWGPFLAWGNLPCGVWPVRGGEGPRRITAEGSGPIVVVGTTRDPATPYEWAVRLRDQLAHGVLITYVGDGHTAYMRSNSCVDDAIDAYYVAGTVPEDGLKC